MSQRSRFPRTKSALLLFTFLLTTAAAPASTQDPTRNTLRLLATSAAGSIDPQINYTAQFWQIFAPVYDGLVAFKKVPGPDGTTIVPDLAETVPTPEDGRIYRFHLRPNLVFATGAPLGAADVIASFRRIFKVGSPTAETFYGTIEGAQACLASPDTCTLPGVQAEGDTITITLTRPDPEFLQKLALPHASILPADTPPHDTGTTPIPGTGPWRIASYDPNDALLLDRNPHFRAWNPDAQPPALPDAVRYQFGLEPETEVTSVLNDQADWLFDTPPPDRLAEIATRPAQLHLNPTPAIVFVPLNTRIPPFNDLRARRAFAMAVDRAAIIRLAGGGALNTPQCQITPRGLPGHAPHCPTAANLAPHDLAPRDLAPRDLAPRDLASTLVAQSGTSGQTVTLITDDAPTSRAIGTYLTEILTDLGYRARLQTLSANVQFTYIQNTGNHVQASLTSWYADYPSAANIIAGNFGCAAFHEGSDSSTNIPGFCDPALDAALLAGQTEAVDRAITDQVPAIILYSPQYIDLTARRVDGFVYHETFRWLLQRAILR